MKKNLLSIKNAKRFLGFASLAACLSFIIFSSFTVNRFTDDFLQQLGITKMNADKKITHSLLGGWLDLYDVKNAKNIATGNRKAVVIDLLSYTKKYVTEASFIKEYNEMRESHKPKLDPVQTPEAMKADNIARAKEMVTGMEEAIKKADASTKAIFEESLKQAKQTLKDAQDPNNEMLKFYTQTYPALVKSNKEAYERQIQEWETTYPSNQMLWVKKRLQEFMEATEGVDFNAELVARNGKKYFAKSAYEAKNSRWKMAFRAGKEVVEPTREFVQKWLSEIK